MGHWPPRRDPGPCPICGTASCACTTPGYDQIAVPQLPHRDAMGQPTTSVTPTVQDDTTVGVDLQAEQTVSTKTYRGDPKRKRR